jgi:glycosyltransferase involved in cell wall biosynthesis
VIARPCGSVPEVIRPGVTGYIVKSVDEMAAAVGKIEKLSREDCRREFESRFTAEIMVDRYEQVYRRLIEEAQHKPVGKPKETHHQVGIDQSIGKASESGL